MSIYFVHFVSAFLPLSFILAFLFKDLLKPFVAVLIGCLFGYFAFYIAMLSLRHLELSFYVNIVYIASLLGILVLFRSSFLFLKFILLFCFSFCVSVKYLLLSQDFPIFASVLDTTSIISFSLIILAFLLCVALFYFFRWQKIYNMKLSFTFLLLLILCESSEALAHILLIAMREKLIGTEFFIFNFEFNVLSFVAKNLYFAAFTNYLYLFLVLLLAFLALSSCPKPSQKGHFLDIAYRQNKALVQKFKFFFTLGFASVLFCMSMLLYFDKIASKPISIDPPKEILPINDEFVFDIELLRDNNLHRFAYVTSEGKVVRFFLINKREDRDSPVAVFDSCMICGDMGYVKKGGELICISCNVRIFLPSVGKEGGCNPIPLAYSFDGQKIRIKLEDVIAGSNYFTQIKEIEVSDPISGEKVLNTKAPYSYSYAGLSYYFVNEKNYELFKAEPEKYVSLKKSPKFRVQAYGE